MNSVNAQSGHTEFEKCITESKKILLHSYSRIVIRWKFGRGVPILLWLDMRKHFNCFISMRNNYITDNKYVFQTQGFLDGTKIFFISMPRNVVKKSQKVQRPLNCENTAQSLLSWYSLARKILNNFLSLWAHITDLLWSISFI